MILLAKDLEKFDISAVEMKQKEKGVFVPVISIGPECAICFDNLKDPQTLACGHGFCKCCVEKLATTAIFGVQCPLCRAPSKVQHPAAAGSNPTTQTMYEFLHAKRAAYLEKSSVTRREAVW